MNGYLLLVIILAIVAILSLFFASSITTLKTHKEKMTKAESIIEENLDKKLNIILALNTSIKKVTGKKDYLKDYITNDMINSSFEKDMKLDEAVKLINDLTNDFSELNKDNEFNKNIKSLREVDEVLIAAKNLFNKNAVLSNGLIKNFPYNIVAKIAKFKIRSYYNNKTDDGDNF